MKHKLLLIFFLLPFISLAQSNYQPGYVVNLKGDTLHGFIDYQAWEINPSSISFKTAVTDRNKQTFTVNNASSFEISRLATYKKFVCSISMDITNTSQLVSGRDTSFRTGAVFLKVLQKGENLALYSYTDDLKTRFYFGEAPGYLPTELVYRVYFDSSSANGTVNENTYLKQFFALANKYHALDDKLTALLENPYVSYDKGNLIKIVSRINNISKAEFENKYTEHSKFSVYLSAALNISNTTSDAGSSYTAGGGVPTTSNLPAVAIGVNLIPNPNGGRAELRADLSVNPAQFNALYQLKVSPYTGIKASYNQLGFFFTPQVLYNLYNTPNFKFYIGFGITLAYFTYSKPYFQSQNTSSPNPYAPIETYIFNETDNAFLIKAGFKIHKKWEIYFNYFTDTNATKGGYFALTDQNKQVGVSYFF